MTQVRQPSVSQRWPPARTPKKDSVYRPDSGTSASSRTCAPRAPPRKPPAYIIIERHFKSMKDGAIICNTGHYDCEINIPDLEKVSKSKREVRKDNEEYTFNNGKRVFLLAQGRLVNLAAAEGHPSEVMDMSFANQFMSQLRLVENHKKGKRLENKVYDIPAEQDQEIAVVKLATMGYKIDKLTAEQVKYNEDYSAGT
jgi:adenosylhomocysteinase